MNTSNPSVSVCRHCQYYRVEGRRGGYCQQLCAQVQSSWKACSLAIPPFAPSWEALPGIMAWRNSITSPLELQPEVVRVEADHAAEPLKIAINRDI